MRDEWFKSGNIYFGKEEIDAKSRKISCFVSIIKELKDQGLEQS